MNNIFDLRCFISNLFLLLKLIITKNSETILLIDLEDINNTKHRWDHSEIFSKQLFSTIFYQDLTRMFP